MDPDTMAKSKSKSRRSPLRKEWVPRYEVKRNSHEDLIRIRDIYYEAIGFPYEETKSREHRNVIFRIAFADAMQHYYQVGTIGKALEKDHSSVSYYIKQSPLYEQWYDFYKLLREAATCIYHLEVGSTALGFRLKENIKQYVEALDA